MAMRNGRPDPEIYERAAEVIEERGLHKGEYVNEKRGSVCLYGALSVAGAERKRLRAAFDEEGFPIVSVGVPADVRKALNIRGDLADWNDRPSRRKAQVVAKLRQMAEIERSLR